MAGNQIGNPMGMKLNESCGALGTSSGQTFP
jgi:hypothetical protein